MRKIVEVAASTIISKSEAATVVMASKSPAGDPFAERAPIWRTIKFTQREDLLTIEDYVTKYNTSHRFHISL